MAKIRVDLLLVEKGLAPSRHRAAALIMAGRVLAGGKRISKAGDLIADDAKLAVAVEANFVSRGGVKLAGALTSFRLDPSGLLCLDIGASTGGFTDCLLQNGARKVYAVDVGYGQLDAKLRSDPRVVVIEKTNVRYLKKLPEPFDLAVIDVSFISLTKILPAVIQQMAPGGRIVPLVKPQFELSPKEVKKGVVRDDALRQKAVDAVKKFAGSIGLKILGEVDSVLAGPKGNREVFIHLQVC